MPHNITISIEAEGVIARKDQSCCRPEDSQAEFHAENDWAVVGHEKTPNSGYLTLLWITFASAASDCRVSRK